jgi:hypothetical protein
VAQLSSTSPTPCRFRPSRGPAPALSRSPTGQIGPVQPTATSHRSRSLMSGPRPSPPPLDAAGHIGPESDTDLAPLPAPTSPLLTRMPRRLSGLFKGCFSPYPSRHPRRRLSSETLTGRHLRSLRSPSLRRREGSPEHHKEVTELYVPLVDALVPCFVRTRSPELCSAAVCLAEPRAATVARPPVPVTELNSSHCPFCPCAIRV